MAAASGHQNGLSIMPELAPIYSLKVPRVVSIEYPANVVNPVKAIDMVGGPQAIARSVEDRSEPLELRLRPGDPFEHPVSSRTSKYHNIVLKIKLSKKHLDAANGNVRKALELAKGDYEAVPAYIAESNFRFREMSDFQYTTVSSPFVQKMRPSLFAGNLSKIRQLDIEGVQPLSSDQIDCVPPPRFSQMVYPFHYAYRQNPAISLIDDGSGGSKLVNTAASQKLESVMVVWGNSIPAAPSSNLVDPGEGPVQRCIDQLQKIFKDRPFWTRKAIKYQVSSELHSSLRYALPYVAYFFKSGPWRGSYGAYGKDPASSTEYAKYQVEYFRLFSKEEETAMGSEAPAGRVGLTSGDNELPPPTSVYMFDGTQLPSAKSLQLADVVDPLIVDLLEKARFRESVDVVDGWYCAEDIHAIRRIMRSKLLACKTGATVDASVIEGILSDSKNAPSRPDNRGVPGLDGESGTSAPNDKPGDLQDSVMQRINAEVAGGSEKLKDLFGYIQQKDNADAGDDLDDYSLMEGDDDDEEDGDSDEA